MVDGEALTVALNSWQLLGMCWDKNVPGKQENLTQQLLHKTPIIMLMHLLRPDM
jgi:hypothetical protein